MKFRKRPVVIDAEQFTDPAHPPRGVYEGTGRFGMPFFVTTIQQQPVEVKVGEWIIAESDGVHYYPCADSEFQRLYEPV
jgi:hypothetical protein